MPSTANASASELACEVGAGLSRWEAVLFDLGGVLLELDYTRTSDAFDRLAGRRLAVYSKTEQAHLFDRFERGELDAATFRAELRALLARSGAARESSITDAELDAAWNALLGGVPAHNLEMLRALRRTHRVYLLSNTNEIHLAAFLERFERDHGARYGSWSDLFHRDYYSHLLGARKPEREIFERVLRAEGLVAERTLFIDDNWSNVLGARAVGLCAAWLDVAPAASTMPPESRDPLLDGARTVAELFTRLRAAAEGNLPVPAQ